MFEPDDHATATAAPPAGGLPFRPFDVPERFTLSRPLGKGGQGSVWLAEDRTLGQRVALKVIDLGERERTIQEARVGRDLDHPHLMRIFDLIELPERLILVMEWLPGGSVKDMLHDGPLPIDEVVSIADQVLEALAYLHDRGIVHRDVKPSNLMIDRSGRVKLGDLGLVRELDRDGDMTRTGLALGTPDYMSPEQLQGEKPAPPTDLYALGATLYELLAGARPFSGSSDLEIANQHIGTTPPSVRSLRPDCPGWLAAFVDRLLEKRPTDRWRDGGAALQALRRRRAPRWRLWRRRATVALILASAVIAGWTSFDRLSPRLESAVVEKNQVVGISNDGSELWRSTFDHRITGTLVADLTASRGNEVAVGVNEVELDTGFRRAVIAILDANGHEVSRFGIDPETVRDPYPSFSAELMAVPVLAGDLDGDSRSDLIWSASHPEWYPNVVGVWWGHRGGTVQPVLVNSGRMFSFAIGDADGDDQPELVASGINNPIGYQNIVAVVEPGRLLFSPDLLHYDLDRIQHTYLPLGPHAGRIMIDDIGAHAIQVRQSSGPVTLHLDTPSEGGRGTVGRIERQEFWQQVLALCRDARAQPEVAARELEKLRDTFPTVLEEPGSRLAVDLLFARALARAGDHEQAIKHLREVTVRHPEITDPWLRLGEQLLISGDRAAGREALRRSMVARTVGRNPYDAILFLTLDAALHNSPPDLEEARRFWAGYTTARRDFIHYEPLVQLAAFFGGQWTDLETGSSASSYYRPVAVIGPWARLERGTDPVVILEEASRMGKNPEVMYPARMLEALALLRLGRNEEAQIAANRALLGISDIGCEHYEAFIWVPVAEWVYGASLEASGDPESARVHFERAARLAPSSWLAAPPPSPRR